MLTKQERKKASEIYLSDNFTLLELIDSANHPHLVQWPPDNIIKELKEFVLSILQPIRDVFGPIRISSGWRNPKLNSAVGGVKNSVHKIMNNGVFIGVACDIVPLKADLERVFNWAFQNCPVKTAIIYRDKKALGIRTPFVHLDTRKNRVGRAKMEKTAPKTYVYVK